MITIPGPLTSLNTYIRAERGNLHKAAKIKRRETDHVDLFARPAEPIETPVQVELHWYCRDKRTDPDNVAFAKKFVLDGLVKAGVLPNDSWAHVAGFVDRFYVDRAEPRVEVYLRPLEDTQIECDK